MKEVRAYFDAEHERPEVENVKAWSTDSEGLIWVTDSGRSRSPKGLSRQILISALHL
jgi:hypothetical protein